VDFPWKITKVRIQDDLVPLSKLSLSQPDKPNDPSQAVGRKRPREQDSDSDDDSDSEAEADETESMPASIETTPEPNTKTSSATDENYEQLIENIPDDEDNSTHLSELTDISEKSAQRTRLKPTLKNQKGAQRTKLKNKKLTFKDTPEVIKVPKNTSKFGRKTGSYKDGPAKMREAFAKYTRAYRVSVAAALRGDRSQESREARDPEHAQLQSRTLCIQKGHSQGQTREYHICIYVSKT
jgi:hypothetical protein